MPWKDPCNPPSGVFSRESFPGTSLTVRGVSNICLNLFQMLKTEKKSLFWTNKRLISFLFQLRNIGEKNSEICILKIRVNMS